jgi:hypothetical protein
MHGLIVLQMLKSMAALASVL